MKFFKEIWNAIQEIRRSAAEIRQLRVAVKTLENRILDQHQMLLRISRNQNNLVDRVAPPIQRLGG